MAVGRVLTSIDKVADYVPGVSTVTNLVDLFQKCVVIPCMSREAINNSHYYTHLSQKSALRCLVLLLPVIGNLVVGIMDFRNRQVPGAPVGDPVQQAEVRYHPKVYELEHATDDQKNNGHFVLEAAKCDYRALQHASEALRDNARFMFAALNKARLNVNEWAPGREKPAGDRVLEYASDRLKSDPEFMRAVVTGLSLQAMKLRVKL